MIKLKKHIVTLDTYGSMDLTEYDKSSESFTILCKDTNNIYHKGSDINTIIVGTDLGIINSELKYVQIADQEYELFMNIADGVFVIPDTIQNKNNIISVTVPKHAYNTTTNMGTSVSIIGDNAFIGCSSLTSVDLSQFIKSIGRASFEGCEKLTTIELPQTIETIAPRSFYNCKALDGIVLPNITIIQSETFYNCKALKQITIPNTVKGIGTYAFKGCDALTQITFNGTHEEWKRINNISNAGFDNLEYVLCTNGNYNYQTGKLDVDPNKVIRYTTNNGRPVTTYVNDWISNTYDAETNEGMIIFGETINSIGFKRIAATYGYFSNNLYTIELPTCCAEIYVQTFYNCTNLISINIENIEIIGNDAFYKCSNLQTLTNDNTNILTKLTSIGNNIFADCSALERVVIGDNLKTLGSYLFNNCNILSEITIGNGISKIQTNAIYKCNNGLPVTLNYNGTANEWINITKEDKYAWYEGTNISEVICVDGDTVIFSNPDYCEINYKVSTTTLNELTISIKDNIVENHVFNYKDRAGNVKMALRVESLTPEYTNQTCFSPSTSLTEITVPKSVTSIGYRAFANANISDIDLTNTFTTSIAPQAFENCSKLTTIKLPRTIQQIAEQAFENCSKLTTVTFAGTMFMCKKIKFNNCFENTNVTVIECINGLVPVGEFETILGGGGGGGIVAPGVPSVSPDIPSIDNVQ